MKPAFDPHRRELLVRIWRERVGLGANPDEVLVSAQDLFLGNADHGSIGCNFSAHPGVETFASILTTVQERRDVQDVLVGITDVNNDAGDSWPFSGRVYIISSASVAEVKDWVQPLSPDDVVEVAGHEPLLRNYRMFDPATKVYLVW